MSVSTEYWTEACSIQARWLPRVQDLLPLKYEFQTLGLQLSPREKAIQINLGPGGNINDINDNAAK